MTLMHPHMIKLLSLSGLTLGLLAASQGVRADEVKAPTFTAEPCCSLCPAAHDAKNYTTRYQQNFTTLVQAQGDWLFRTQEDLRTEFDTKVSLIVVGGELAGNGSGPLSIDSPLSIELYRVSMLAPTKSSGISFSGILGDRQEEILDLLVRQQKAVLIDPVERQTELQD